MVGYESGKKSSLAKPGAKRWRPFLVFDVVDVVVKLPSTSFHFLWLEALLETWPLIAIESKDLPDSFQIIDKSNDAYLGSWILYQIELSGLWRVRESRLLFLFSALLCLEF